MHNTLRERSWSGSDAYLRPAAPYFAWAVDFPTTLERSSPLPFPGPLPADGLGHRRRTLRVDPSSTTGVERVATMPRGALAYVACDGGRMRRYDDSRSWAARAWPFRPRGVGALTGALGRRR